MPRILPQLLTAVTLFTLPAVAVADACYEPSPNLVAQGDDYFAIGRDSALDTKQMNQVAAYIKSIKGDWAGKGFMSECFGTSKNPDVRQSDLEIEANVSSSNKSSLRIDYERYRIDDKVRKLDRILLNANDGSQQWVVRDGGVNVSIKFRVRNANGRSRLVEQIVDLSDIGNGLGVDVATYVNGYLSNKETWQLQAT